MEKERVERRLAAILAADVAGYSRLMGEDEAGTLARLRTHRRELIDPEIAEHKGRIVKTTGDGILIEFPSVVEAVACALAIQRGMGERNSATPEHQRIAFRIGINLGDVIVEDGDIHGDGVNVAARLETLAEAGGICVSAVVHDQVQGRLDCAFDDLGEPELKNIARKVRVYRVRPAGEPLATGSPLALPDKPSIAVLPFANISGDPEQEYFADGMVEEIITALSRIRWLFVIARNSSFTYKGRAVDVKQVARELGVRYVLEGSVRKGGNRLRITGQLIDTATGAHIWADRFDGALDNIFELQDQVASSVVGAIEPRLRRSEFERVSRKPTESLDAYDLYLRALALRDKPTAESVPEAIALLKRALAIDPGYAPAKALIGFFRVHQSAHGRSPASEADGAEAVTLAKQALEAGRDDPDALWMAAYTLIFLAGERDIAAAAIDRALTLNPNSALAWAARGMVLCGRGQPDQAIEACQRAMRLSPLDSLRRMFTMGMAIAHSVAGRYDEALDWVERTLHAEPSYLSPLRLKAIACAHLDRIEEAQIAVRQLLEAQPWNTVTRIQRLFSRTLGPEIAARFAEGLRKAGLPEG